MTLDLSLDLFISQFLTLQGEGCQMGPLSELDFQDSLLSVEGEIAGDLMEFLLQLFCLGLCRIFALFSPLQIACGSFRFLATSARKEPGTQNENNRLRAGREKEGQDFILNCHWVLDLTFTRCNPAWQCHIFLLYLGNSITSNLHAFEISQMTTFWSWKGLREIF